MTTDATVYFADNLFEDNDVLNLRRPNGFGEDLAGVAFLHSPRPDRMAGRLRGLKDGVKALQETTACRQLWLCTCDSSWKRENTVFRYYNRRLWKTLEHRGLAIPSGMRSDEVARRDPDRGVRYFGTVEVPTEELSLANAIAEGQSESFFVLTASAAPDIEGLLDHGWSDSISSTLQRHRKSLESLICYTVFETNAIFVRQFGWFDDQEVGANFMLKASMLDAVRDFVQANH